MSTDRLAYSIPEAAAASSLSRATLYRLAEAGELRMIRIGRRTVIPASDLARLIEGVPAGGSAA